MKNLIENIKRVNAIADVGLLYSQNEYDKERYVELKEIAVQMMAETTASLPDQIKEAFIISKDYPTAKADVRGLLLSDDNKILLVKESADGKWALPGGWGDIGYSPSEVIIKEFKEETGLDVIPEKLLAVMDKKMHPHPPQPFYVYKLIFYCKAISTKIIKGFDVLDVQYFSIKHLPELSKDRILDTQLEMLYNKIMRSDFETYFD